MVNRSQVFLEKSSPLREEIAGRIAKKCPDLSLEVLVMPFGDSGARIAVYRSLKKGVYPVAMATTVSLEPPLKDLANGLWGSLSARMRDEVRFLKKELKKAKV